MSILGIDEFLIKKKDAKLLFSNRKDLFVEARRREKSRRFPFPSRKQPENDDSSKVYFHEREREEKKKQGAGIVYIGRNKKSDSCSLRCRVESLEGINQTSQYSMSVSIRSRK